MHTKKEKLGEAQRGFKALQGGISKYKEDMGKYLKEGSKSKALKKKKK